MSYLDRIAECNNHDPALYRPFRVAGRRVGWLRRPFLERLRDFPEVFHIDADAVSLDPGLDDFESRSEALDGVLRGLAGDGLIAGWRGEQYPVATGFTEPSLMQMERAATPLFGVRAYGIHVNGFVRDRSEIKLWVARRSQAKPSYPGELDNFVAGGQPIGIGLLDNVIKEAAEEADVPASIAARAVAVGSLSYCHEIADGEYPGGLKPDVIFVYDLELPADFEPRNTDGEIDEFYLWSLSEAMAATRESSDFKYNCALVNIDFFMRHGALDPDSEPDYLDIAWGLRGSPGGFLATRRFNTG